MIKSFPNYAQLDQMDCGATCLRMVAKYYGRSYSSQSLREKSFITRSGVSLLGISEAAESIGFRTMGVKIPLSDNFRSLFRRSSALCRVRRMQKSVWNG